MFKFIGLTLLLILIINYFTNGYGNTEVRQSSAQKQMYIAKYCKQMMDDGYFKNNQAKCFNQQRRAWDADGTGVIKAEIISGWK